MPRGYVLPRTRPGQTYEAFRDAFAWDLPDQYNIATECLSAADPTRTALYHVDEDGGHHELSFEALDRAAEALAGTMASWGITEGGRVAICFPQSPELLIAHFATYKLGAIAVPVSVLLGGDSMAYTLSHSRAELLFIDEAVMADFDDPGVFEAAERRAPITIDPGRYGPADDHLGGFAAVNEPDATTPSVETTPDTPGLMLYTSGSSGKPKGVLQGHRYLIGSLPSIQLGYNLVDTDDAADERFWTPSEWAWAAALFDVVFPALALDGTVVSYVRRSGFDAEQAPAFMAETDVTGTFLPPTALTMIREAHPSVESPPSSLEVVLTGGEPLNPAVGEWVERELGAELNEGYGQTEANVTVGNCSVLFESKPGSMGRPWPGHDIVVMDDDENRLGADEVGELGIVGPDPVFFIEYWDAPETTTEKFTDDGVLKTGDMVLVDEDGYVWFRGRKDDLIIASGYRISPVEVEEALEAHPLVDDAVAGGVPGPGGGTNIKAYLRVDAAAGSADALDFEALRQLVKDDLGAHKAPDEFEVLRDPPTTRTGKIDRTALFGRE